MKSVVRLLSVAVFLFIASALGAGHALAYSDSRLMDDPIFDNAGTMSEAAIQSFLAAKGPCLANYYDVDPTITWVNGNASWSYSGSVPASHIIYKSSQQWGINPQVILATLQKEESLITGTDCSGWRYNSAMGYGCPDSGGCNAKWAGFTRQVLWGSWQLKFDKERANGNIHWDGDDAISYNRRMTGGTYLIDNVWVTMETGATASLYNYTPHLHQMFPYWFEAWFGSTIVTSPLVKVSGENGYYLLRGTHYYLVPSQEVLQAYALQYTPVTTVDSTFFTTLTRGPDLSALVRYDDGPAIYVVENGQKHGFTSADVFYAYGYTYGQETVYDAALGGSIANGDSMTPLMRRPDGTIYLIESGKKRLFPDYTTYANLGTPHYNTQPITNFGWHFTDITPDGAPMILDGRMVRAGGDDNIYLYDQSKLWLLTPASYRAWGSRLDYTQFTATQLSQITSAGFTPTLVKSTSSTNYLIDLGVKYTVGSQTAADWGLADTSFQTSISDAALSRLSTKTLSSLTQGDGDAIYLMSSGAKHHIPTGFDFNGFGFVWGSQSRVSDASLATTTTGVDAFAPGSLIRVPTGTVFLTDNNFTKITISTGDMFNQYGFPWSAVRNYPQTTIDAYSGSQTLNSVAVDSSGNYYLIDLGKRWALTAQALSATEYGLGTAPNTTLSTSVINKITYGGVLDVYVRGSGPTVYMVQDGQKHPFTSETSLKQHGGSLSQVLTLSDAFIASLATGAAY